MGKLDKQVRAMPEAGFLPLEENRVQEEVINKGTGQETCDSGRDDK